MLLDSSFQHPGPVSADLHVCEPRHCSFDHIEVTYRVDAPRAARDAHRADHYWIKNEPYLVPMPQVAAVTRDGRDIEGRFVTCEEMHTGGWDPAARVEDQDVDGVVRQILYHSIGMTLCQNPDVAYKSACMWAYVGWLQEFVSHDPDLLFGVGHTAVRSVPEALEDIRRLSEMGRKAVMLPAQPATHFDYDDPAFDPLWEAAVDLELPVSFRMLTSSSYRPARGSVIKIWSGANQGVQEMIGMFILGGVLDRHPRLRLVWVESDAGWARHSLHRLHHVYKWHRHVNKSIKLQRPLSEQFRQQTYLAFHDDEIALQLASTLNVERMTCGNDFPHADSTWPRSSELLTRQAGHPSVGDRDRICRTHALHLCGIGSPDAAMRMAS